MKMHPVLHVLLLDPTSNDPIPGQIQLTSSSITVEQEEEYTVEEILDS